MATLADVAKHAGVSQSTVSYVLSGKRSISPATRRRVERSIRTLGYRPHAGARALASRRTSVLALVTPLRADLHTPVAMEFVASVVTAARRAAHDVLLLTNDEGPEGIRRVGGSALVDGLILMDVELRDERVQVLRMLGLPAVLIGVPEDASGLTCIDLDFRAAGARCVDHLADLGHRAVVFVGHSEEVYARGSGFAARMLEGVSERAAARGLACRHVRPSARRDELEAIAAGLDESALIVHNEAVLPVLLDALRSRVPDDVSVVAVAPSAIAEMTTPAVSAVDLPAAEMGERAVGLLMAKLAGREELGSTLLPPRLVVRESSKRFD